jgi:hypothetical protein
MALVKVPPHARVVPDGRGHRFAAYPRCSADLPEAGRRTLKGAVRGVRGGAVLSRLLPEHFDNTFRGNRIGIWLFALVVFVQTGQGLMSVFNGRYAASAPDAIPLGSYSSAAADTVVALFALLGLLRLVICLLCVLALLRYRAMIPLMFTLLVLEYLSRRVILHVLPIERSGAPPGSVVNLVLLALMIVGLALSVQGKSHDRERE